MNHLYSRVLIKKRKFGEDDWEDIDNAILVPDATGVSVERGLGKKRDTFTFKIHNYHNNIFETYYDGNGGTTYTLKYYPIPDTYIGTEKFRVFVKSGTSWVEKTTSQYSVSGSTITFTSAVSSGVDNIKVFFPLLEIDDLVRIFQWKNKTWNEMTTIEQLSSIREEGVITEPALTANDSGKIITIRGNGLLDILFKGLAFVKPSANKHYAWHFICDIIKELNEYNQGGGGTRRLRGETCGRAAEGAFPAETTDEWADMGNGKPTTKEVPFNSSWKPAIDQIEDLSSDENTGDGQYIYWVEYNPNTTWLYGSVTKTGTYDFRWIKKDTSVSSNTLVEGSEVSNISAEKDIDEVYNSCIYNCGYDCDENGQEYFHYDASGGYGGRWLYVTETNTIGPNLINKEFETNPTKFPTTDDGARMGTSENNYNSNYPKEEYFTGGAEWTFQFKDRVGGWFGSGTPRTGASSTSDANGYRIANSYASYNDAIRLESFWQGKVIAARIIDLHNDPKYKVTVEIPYGNIVSNNTYVLGELDNTTINSFGIYAKPLRIQQITYDFWTTNIEYTEDETT